MDREKEEAYVVETRGLTKKYKGKTAVDHLDLKVRPGAVYGFIGRNGAGKSTTLRMICGLAKPTAGEIRLFGREAGDVYAARRIGCLIESAGLYPNLTARQNMMAKAKCMGLADEKSVDAILDRTGLSETGGKRTKFFSMGMKQRLGVALALLGNPDLLILDEPINGLDPEGVREMRRLILRLQEEGKTFLISSHILGELNRISTHYGIIRDGRLVEQLSERELEEKCTDYFQIEVDDVRRALPLIEEQMPGMTVEACDAHKLRIYFRKKTGMQAGDPDSGAQQNTRAELPAGEETVGGARLNRLLVENGIQVYASGFHHMDLEEYFLACMDGGTDGEKEERAHV